MSTSTPIAAFAPKDITPASEFLPVSLELKRHRLESIDVLRGLLMIVMALDHTRDFFSNANVDPTNPLQSWPALFFTRWVTHLCAPGFVALAGTSVYLQRQRGLSASSMARKLVARGVWLIFIEVAIVSFGIFFTYDFHLLQVIYAIGGSMIVLALLQFLPTGYVAAYGFIIVCLHNLLDKVQPHQAVGLWKLFVMPGPFLNHGQIWIRDKYPILPWSGVMALGYAFGAIVTLPGAKRRVRAVQYGLIALALFAVLRISNGYGDPLLFSHLATPQRTVMSFFQVTKYPPSLHYVCATFGFLLLLFALFDHALEERWVPRALGVLAIYGRVPFFYYIPHFYILHTLAVIAVMFSLHTTHVVLQFSFDSPPPGTGFGLPVVYAVWASVVGILYLPCKWFAGVKARRRDWWLSYL